MLFYQLGWIFITASFLGWCAEVAYAAYKQHKFVNRGFLNGPVCPIYGAALSVLFLTLSPLRDRPVLLFLCSFVLTTLVEFLTGYLMLRLFHHRWWDYSDRKFNIGGYVCLRFSLFWGAVGFAFVKWVFPPFLQLITAIDFMPGVILLSVLFGILIGDTIATECVVAGLNSSLRKLSRLKKKPMRVDKDTAFRIWMHAMASRLSFRRLMDAFPSMRSIQFDDELDSLRELIEEEKTPEVLDLRRAEQKKEEPVDSGKKADTSACPKSALRGRDRE